MQEATQPEAEPEGQAETASRGAPEEIEDFTVTPANSPLPGDQPPTEEIEQFSATPVAPPFGDTPPELFVDPALDADPLEEPAPPGDTLATEPDPSGNPFAGDALSGGDVVMSAAHRRRWGGVVGGEREIRKED